MPAPSLAINPGPVAKSIHRVLALRGDLSNRVIAGVLGLALVAGLTAGVTFSMARVSPNAFNPTAAELAQWRRETATPMQRAEMVANIRAAFAGVAQVGVGAMPQSPGQSSTAGPEATASPAGSAASAQLILAFGVSGDHFWITASYADMSRGAIWGAVAVCDNYAPSWVCDEVGNILTSWSNGWGSGNSHGVWAAVYWWPPHFTGGRW